ncbi:hypothetical protein, partial [Streptomyces sp. gb1(2016)]|uniref:rhamnogalacturonan lyase family protein n=1 Tax=Streptomyces sp. gb1(2016) TaxID=1828321 RepID=UPI001C9C231C
MRRDRRRRAARPPGRPSARGYGRHGVDGIRLDGTRLWRIDLGRNIRSGAHYTQFQVYDYDGLGRNIRSGAHYTQFQVYDYDG